MPDEAPPAGAPKSEPNCEKCGGSSLSVVLSVPDDDTGLRTVNRSKAIESLQEEIRNLVMA